MDWGYTSVWMSGLRYITHFYGMLGLLTQTHCRCRAGSQFVNGHQFAEAVGKRFVIDCLQEIIAVLFRC